MRKIAITSVLLLGLAYFCTPKAEAAVSITAATGGTNLSADLAQNSAAPAFTTLGNIVITEGNANDFASGTSRTLILTAPSGWRFNAGVGTATAAKVSGNGGNEVAVDGITVTSSNITVTITISGTGNINSLTVSNIQVQATDGGNVPAAGSILRTSANPGTASINGITSGTTNFGSLSQAVGALRLYVVLPGQTFTNAATLAASGITGTPTAQTAGTAFNITKLVAADRQFNIDSTYSGAKTISYSGPGGTPSYTTAVSFTSGQSTTTLATTLRKAETTTITATDGTVAGVASSSLAVNAAPFTKLQLLVPGETATPGTASGKTGAPASRTAGIAFTVTVNAVDANWNFINTVSDTVGITSSDGSATLPADTALTAGTQTFNVTFNTAGSQTLTATNITNGSVASDTSPSITVNNPPTTTVVTSSDNPSVFGQSVTFTASVTQVSGSITPTGTATFKDGATALGTGTLDGAGQATFAVSSLSVGSHSITAVYGGDSNYSGSTSPALTQTVNKANASTTVVSGVNPSVFGQSVTFTATVSSLAPGAGTPTGTVAFKDGATTLGTGTLSAAQATLTTSLLSAGSHSITAVYNGDSSFNTSTSL